MTLPNAVVKNIEYDSSIGGRNGDPINAENGDSMGGQIGGSIGGSIQLTTRQKEILSLIENDTQISKRQFAQFLKINHSAVDKHIEYLKSKGVLERIGGTRGYWQVNLSE